MKSPAAKNNAANLLPYGGDMRLLSPFIPAREADAYFTALMDELNWQEETLMMFGQPRKVPRLIAWHGDASYKYSGVMHTPAPWTPTLKKLKQLAEDACGANFNSVLGNLYRTGQDGMGYHADDEPELSPTIASLSFGAERTFRIKPKRGGASFGVALPHGSILMMGGDMQKNWLHSLPKTAKPISPRINLTFRHINETI